VTLSDEEKVEAYKLFLASSLNGTAMQIGVPSQIVESANDIAEEALRWLMTMADNIELNADIERLMCGK